MTTTFRDTGQSPHVLGKDAFLAQLKGEEVPPSEVKRIRSKHMTSPPPGSNNWNVEAEVVTFRGGHSPASRLIPFLTGQNGWNTGGNEVFNPNYNPWRIGPVLGIPLESEIRPERDAWLRATWAMLTLCAQPKAPERVIFRMHDQEWERPRFRSGFINGPFTLGAANRHAEDPKRDDKTGTWTDITAHHTLVGRVAGVRVEHEVRHGDFQELERRRDFPMLVTQMLHPGPVPASFYGVSLKQRGQLQRFLENPTDPVAAAPIAEWLRTYTQLQNVRYRIYRLTDGTVVTVMSATRNGNRPGSTVTVLTPTTAEVLIPARFAKAKAPTGYGEASVKDGYLYDVKATSGLTVLRPYTLPRFPIAWSVEWTDKGATFHKGAADATTIFTGPPPPDGPDLGAEVMSSDVSLVDPMMERIAAVSSTMGRGERAMNTAGELVRRMGTGDGNVVEAALHTLNEVNKVWGDR